MFHYYLLCEEKLYRLFVRKQTRGLAYITTLTSGFYVCVSEC